MMLKNTLGWGFALWLIGYLLGIVLFMIVPTALIGWILTPIGIIITLWVLLKKIRGSSFKDFFALSITWTLIAVICDYLFLVLLFKPADGYYKLDVYIYYALTFMLPLMVYGANMKHRKL